MHIYDMIIIGGGPAGYTAALYSAHAGLDAVLFEKLSAGGQMALTGDIDNYPGFENGIDGFTLGEKMQKGAERLGVKTQYAEVLDLDLSEQIKKVKTADNVFYGQTVVIASGANPRELGITKESELIGSGVHYCAHCDGRFYKDKTVVVVGGGNSAVTDALYLSRLAKKVYLIHRRDKLRATKIYYEALLKAENIEIVWNSMVVELLADERVNGIKIKNVTDGVEACKSANADVIVAVGGGSAIDTAKGISILMTNSDRDLVSLKTFIDSTWTDVKDWRIEQDSLSPRR